MCRCHPPMVWMTVLSLSSSSPRAISSVFIHRIILQRDSGSPAAQPTDTFAGGRDSLPAFSGALQRAMVKKTGKGDSCNGRPSEAEEEEEEGGSTQNVTPLLLSHMLEAGGENSEREAMLGCLGEMDAFKCGVMLLRLMKGWCWWKCSDGDSQRSANGSSAHENRTLDASNADGGVMKQQAASFAHSCFGISTHDGANLCRPGRQRGRGREGQCCGFYTAANDPTLTSSVKIRHSSHYIEETHSQIKLVIDLCSLFYRMESKSVRPVSCRHFCGQQSATVVFTLTHSHGTGST